MTLAMTRSTTSLPAANLPSLIHESDRPAVLSAARGACESPAADVAREFQRLLTAESGRLVAAAIRVLKNREEAEDAVQSALLSAWRALPTFDGRARLSTWLTRIVINAALMKLRSRRREDGFAESLLSAARTDETLTAETTDGAIAGELPVDGRIVRRLVARLPQKYRQVVELRYFEQRSTRAAAGALGIEEATVKVRLHRAIGMLRKSIVADAALTAA